MSKIGAPLFIFRYECEKDLMAVIEKLSEIGYDGIEFFGFFGHTPSDIKRKLDSCRISAIGNHVPFDEFVSSTDTVIADHKELGCKYISILPPCADGFPGGCNYSSTLNSLRLIGEKMNKAGMTLLYHNHAEELQSSYNGKSYLHNIMDDVAPDLMSFEPDLGWMQIGGAEPMDYLAKYANRCPVVHFKDYIPGGEAGYIFRPTGYGVVNNAALYQETQTYDKKPEWYVLDHDCAYDRDIYYDMKISLEYFENLMFVSR